MLKGTCVNFPYSSAPIQIMQGGKHYSLHGQFLLQHSLHLHIEAVDMEDAIVFGEVLRVEGDDEGRPQKYALR